MSSGYAIFNINVTNPENYKHYIEQVSSVAEKFGAEYITVSYTHLTLPTNREV